MKTTIKTIGVIAVFASVVAISTTALFNLGRGDNEGVAYSIKGTFEQIKEAVFPAKPCARPITYSLGAFDERFEISKEQFLKTASEAAGVWGEAFGKKLFEQSASPKTDELKVNLVYDYRQQATEKLGMIGVEIKNDRATYEVLKAKYDSLLASYRSDKSEIESEFAAFNSRKKEYENTVRRWNERGGAPSEEFRELEIERLALNEEAAALNAKQETFNELVNTLNSAVTVLNRLVRDLNLSVRNYNTIGASTGEEFSEGEYVLDGTGERINIYQFNDLGQLKRVLEHEFGHALGLDHVEDPKAIMYRLNEGTNDKLTAADIAELGRACGVK